MLRSLDLFGQPVLLTHKGESYYKTGLGGCVSLTLCLAILVGAILRLRQVYFEPEFYALPPDYNFNPTGKMAKFEVSPLAMALWVVDSNFNYTMAYGDSIARIRFYLNYKNAGSDDL